MALRKAPDLAHKVQQCYVMGGAAATLGNITPAAEYNIWVDPDAARIVFHSGLPILMVGWEHCRRKAALDAADMKHVRTFRRPCTNLTLDCNAPALKAATAWRDATGPTRP